MKMITAIVNKKDAGDVCRALRKSNFVFTKMASTGGFLSTGNTTLLIGTGDERVEEAIELVRRNSAKRSEPLPSVYAGESTAILNPYPTEVVVGGAVVFVTDVCRFEKM